MTIIKYKDKIVNIDNIISIIRNYTGNEIIFTSAYKDSLSWYFESIVECDFVFQHMSRQLVQITIPTFEK